MSTGAWTKALVWLLVVAQAYLIWLAFWPHHTGHDWVLFSNDGPLGLVMSEKQRMPDAMNGVWNDLEWLGNREPGLPLAPSAAIRLLPGLVYFGPAAMLFLWWLERIKYLGVAFAAFSFALSTGLIALLAWALFDQPERLPIVGAWAAVGITCEIFFYLIVEDVEEDGPWWFDKARPALLWWSKAVMGVGIGAMVYGLWGVAHGL